MSNKIDQIKNPSRRGIATKLLDALVEREKSKTGQQRNPKAKPANP